ncbi:MAG: hypothetical protein M0Z88_08830, partial [Actinomycetota bacterium]|nr:hypothetical protein [Actinomycetota bacterium]
MAGVPMGDHLRHRLWMLVGRLPLPSVALPLSISVSPQGEIRAEERSKQVEIQTDNWGGPLEESEEAEAKRYRALVDRTTERGVHVTEVRGADFGGHGMRPCGYHHRKEATCPSLRFRPTSVPWL